MMKILSIIVLAMRIEWIVSEGLPECSRNRETVEKAHLGWPKEISCRRMKFAYVRFLAVNGRYGQGDNTTCSIINAINNKTLWSTDVDMRNIYSSQKYLTADVEPDSPRNYYVVVKGDSACFYENITLSIMPTDDTCDKNEGPMHDFPRRPSVLSQLICDDDVLPTKDSYNYTIEWFRNCSKIKTDNNELYTVKDNSLVIPSADFNISGVYSCAFRYKGQTRFVRRFAFCVKPPTVVSEPAISCPSSRVVAVGDDVKITCKVDEGPTPKNSLLTTTILWKQVRNNYTSQCRCAGDDHAQTGFEGKARCFMNVSHAESHNEKCYLYEPTDEEKSPHDKIHDITLHLSDMQLEDFGTYHVTYKSFGRTVKASVKIERRSVAPESGLPTNVYILIGLISGLVAFLILTLLVCILRKSHRQNKNVA